MSNKQINIEFNTEGKINIEGVGFTGRECDEKMKAFEKELGTVQTRKNKPEYLRANKVGVNQKVGGV